MQYGVERILTLKQLPFPFAEKEEHLLGNIAMFDYRKYSLVLNAYWYFLGMKEEGKACERVVIEIDKIICHHI